MKIGINASFARKKDSGMGQVAVNFLKSLIKIGDPQDSFFIYLEEELDLELPKNFHKKVVKTLYRRDDLFRKIYWEKVVLPIEAWKDGCEVFFSLYQSPTIFLKIPHLMLVHDAIVKIFPWYLNNLRRKIYYQKVDEALIKAKKIMTVSNHSKLDVVRLYQKNEKDITVNHIDCDPIFKKKTSAEQIEKALNKYKKLKLGKYIFYAGGFEMRKNVNSLIHAYGLLWDGYENKKDCPDLVLAGKFNPHLVPLVTDIEAEIAQVFYRFGTPKNKFKLIGFVEQADLPALYKGASVFCFPSLYEGFGLPVLEAFNCGCPVVASTNSSLKELANKKNSFIFDLDDDQDLADKLLECLTEKDSLKKQKIMEAKKSAEQFSWEKFTRKALRELKSLKVKSS